MTIGTDITLIIQREYGPKTAMTVLAALEVAVRRWTAEDTVLYGTNTRDNLVTITTGR